MKMIERILMVVAMMAVMVGSSFAQGKVDEERMQRDIEVAENILSTLLKQQFDKRSFFPMEVHGNYRPGYGVTFQLPSEINNNFFVQSWASEPMTITTWGEEWEEEGPGSYSNNVGSTNGKVVYRNGSGNKASEEEIAKARANADRLKNDQQRKNDVIVNGQSRIGKARARVQNQDSIQDQSINKMLNAAKEFITDYGDLISQLAPNERIIITNRGEGNQNWFGVYNLQNRNPYLSVEGLKSEIAQFRQGKISRTQLMGKLKVINTESENELHPDLELLTSIFNRLYRSDLSKTYFTQENTYYERLKDYGVIYYLQVYSTNQDIYGDFVMPTLGNQRVDPETRDKKVTEMYPAFTKSIKEDILEYGRTLKSLKDEESVIFNIKLTRCKGCAIPTWVEYAIKYSVLKDYSNGKLSKESALEKITEKKGELQ